MSAVVSKNLRERLLAENFNERIKNIEIVAHQYAKRIIKQNARKGIVMSADEKTTLIDSITTQFKTEYNLTNIHDASETVQNQMAM